MSDYESALQLEVEIFYDSRALADHHLDECSKSRTLAREAKSSRARAGHMRAALDHYLLSHAALDILESSARRLARLLDARPR